ncbi:hypothetical protein [Chlamydia vaughanii]|uniref:hypothetical protein n=1 Tax=Chlamydia vaughanii TaxID=3112552 RepID=UPI0032B29B72
MITLSSQASLTPCSESVNFWQSTSLKIIVSFVVTIAASVLIILGSLNLAGVASFWLLIGGCVLLGFVILGAVLSVISTILSRSEVVSPDRIGLTERPALNAEAESAIVYAQQSLQLRKASISPAVWEGITPPLQSDLSYFIILRREKVKELRKALNIQEDGGVSYDFTAAAWKNINAIAEQYLQLSFSISYYTLKELLVFLKTQEDVISIPEVLSDPRYCYYLSFYALPTAYYTIRFLHAHGTISKAAQDRRAVKFYQPTTKEYSFRKLYNCFCEQARWYLGNQELIKGDRSLITHTKADLGLDFTEPDNLA